MSEFRRPATSILLKKQGKKSVKIDLYFASEFGQNSGFRVRVDGKWLSDSGKYDMRSFRQVVQMVADQLAEELGVKPEPFVCEPESPEAPDIPAGARVKVYNGNVDPDGTRKKTLTFTKSAPVPLVMDGTVKWCVPVTLYGRGCVHAPVDEIEII